MNISFAQFCDEIDISDGIDSIVGARVRVYRLNKVSITDRRKQNEQMNEKILSHNFVSSNRTSCISDVPKSINDQPKRSETISTVIVTKVKKSHKSKASCS